MWYFLNHSDKPNLVLKMIDLHLCWVSNQDIKMRSELFFRYQIDPIEFDEPKI